MEAVRQIVDSNLLSNVIALPRNFLNRKVEVFIFRKEEDKALPSLTKNDIDEMLKDSVSEALVGILPQSDRTLEDYRAERLSKYECAD